MKKSLILALTSILLLAGCANKPPTWEGYSQEEIAAWKALDVEPATAIAYSAANLNAESVGKWITAGFTSSQEIISWTKAKFAPEAGAGWKATGLKLAEALNWRDNKFTAQETKDWLEGGFNISSAKENRDKGLTPIQ